MSLPKTLFVKIDGNNMDDDEPFFTASSDVTTMAEQHSVVRYGTYELVAVHEVELVEKITPVEE